MPTDMSSRFFESAANEDNGQVDWAMLSFGDGAVMFNGGGQRTASDLSDGSKATARAAADA
jgi:hypothetical protein